MDRDEEIKALEARLAELKSEAVVHPPAPRKTPWREWIGVVGAGVLILWVLIVVITPKPHVSQPADQPGQSTYGAAAIAAAAPEPTILNDPWRYRDEPDPMTDKVTHIACVTSTERVVLSSPYVPQYPELCVRKGPKFGLDAYITLPEGGQFMCRSYSGQCSVKVRRDDAPAVTYSGGEASDGSSDILFIRNAKSLLAAIEAGKVLRIEAEFYQAGLQPMAFPVERFNRALFTGPAKAP